MASVSATTSSVSNQQAITAESLLDYVRTMSREIDLYASRLASHEAEVRRKACAILDNVLREESDTWCLATTGSDARLEKMNDRFSPLEIIIISQEQSQAQRLAALIHSTIAPHSFICQLLEVQSLDHPENICFYANNYFPTRALEAQFILGSNSVFLRYKQQFIEQLSLIPAKAQKLFEKAVLNDAIKQLKLTVENKSLHCSISTGVININAKRIKGTKYSHLRAIQYSLDVIIVDALRSGQLSLDRYLSMPMPITQRLSWMYQMNFFPWMCQEQLQTVQSAYHTAMLLHQVAQAKLEDLFKQTPSTDPNYCLNLKLLPEEDFASITLILRDFIDRLEVSIPRFRL